MEKKSDMLVIINPNAAKGRGAIRGEEVKKAFEKRGVFPDYAYTECEGHGCALSKAGALSGYKTIVACGGDGTVNEVVNGIMESDRSAFMGIVPIGRGNDFAWVAGIPTEVCSAVDLILDSSPRAIDVGYAEGDSFSRYFLNGTGFGFEPAVNFKASSYKKLNGMPSYVAAFIYMMLHVPTPYNIKLTYNGKKEKYESQQISVCNGRRMGSAFIMGPNAIVNDGKLDIMWSNKRIHARQLFSLALMFIKGTQLKSPIISSAKVDEIEIISERPEMKVHADGEMLSLACSRCRLKVHPGALRLFYTAFKK